MALLLSANTLVMKCEGGVCLRAALSSFIIIITSCATHAENISAWVQNNALCCGVNVLAYDPFWKVPTKSEFRFAYFADIHRSGFKSVRIGLRAQEYMDDNYKLDEKWLVLLTSVVDSALENGLYVVIDAHDFIACSSASFEICKATLISYWTQISRRFLDYPTSLMFDLLNEPKGRLTSEEWNYLFHSLIAKIHSDNPRRTVIIEPLGATYTDS